jgi:hypothetical protein
VTKKLASNRSPHWALMERFEVPDYDHPERNYLTRWRLIQTPRFGIFLHRFDGPDPRTTLHDHPWNFVSVVLRGGYVERRLLEFHDCEVDESHRVRFFNAKTTKDAHAITRLTRTPTWTLMLVGRRVREWGYLDWQGHPGKWRWTHFTEHPHAAEFDEAMEWRRQQAELRRDQGTKAVIQGTVERTERSHLRAVRAANVSPRGIQSKSLVL